MLVLLLVFALAARNLARSRVGRAFTAIRDRDIAAGVIGVNLARYKTIAFAVSSFYAGCAGALLTPWPASSSPSSFNLLLSVQYIAMVLIGGAGTISGAILGAFFITLLPRFTRELPATCRSSATDRTRSPNVFQLRDGALRRADHRVPDLRAARALRHLVAHPQLLEGLAILLLAPHTEEHRMKRLARGWARSPRCAARSAGALAGCRGGDTDGDGGGGDIKTDVGVTKRALPAGRSTRTRAASTSASSPT